MTDQVVVGAAVLRDGRLLAARRTAPPELAGRWEVPGGKVDPGETDDLALVRELAEELGVRVRVDRWLHGEEPLGRGFVLRVAVATLIEGDPAPSVHDRLAWLGPDELDAVDWVEADRPFVAQVAQLLLDRGRS